MQQVLANINKQERTAPKKCRYCGGSGWEIQKVRRDDIYGIGSVPVDYAVPCRECKGKQKNTPKYNIRLPYDAYLNAFDTSRYRDEEGNIIDFSQQLDLVKGYIKNYQKVQKESMIKGLYICSSKAGTGKTYLASIICNELYKDYGIVPKYTTETELLNEINATVSYADIKPRDAFKMAQMLFLDDLWRKESGRDWLIDELFNIIDYRYQKGLPVIITSNKDLLNHSIDGRIADRLNEMCAVIQMPEVEIRKQNKPESKKSFWEIIKEE